MPKSGACAAAEAAAVAMGWADIELKKVRQGAGEQVQIAAAEAAAVAMGWANIEMAKVRQQAADQAEVAAAEAAEAAMGWASMLPSSPSGQLSSSSPSRSSLQVRAAYFEGLSGRGSALSSPACSQTPRLRAPPRFTPQSQLESCASPPQGELLGTLRVFIPTVHGTDGGPWIYNLTVSLGRCV